MKIASKRSGVKLTRKTKPFPSTSDVQLNETSSHLFDCALTLFSEKGYDATSVRDIIQAAGVTQPTLYYYCDGKQDLFLMLVRKTYENSLKELQEAINVESTCESRLRAIATVSFAGCAADIRVPKLMFQTAFGPPITGVTETMNELGGQRFAIVRNVIRLGMKSGELANSDADGVSLAFCCLLDQHINVLVRLPNWKKLLTPKMAIWLVSLFLDGATILHMARNEVKMLSTEQ